MKALKLFRMVLPALALMVGCSTFVMQNSSAEAAAPNSDYSLEYEDNFDGGVLNTNDWYYRDSDTVRYGGYSQKENVSVETADNTGYLRIGYSKWDVNNDGVDDLVGGGVMSKRTFGYGYYEARIKFYNNSQGFHQSFWTTGLGYYTSYSNQYTYNTDATNEQVPWSNSMLEIDAIELDSSYNYGAANFHWHKPSFSTPTGANKSYSSTYMNLNNWITVAFDWQPGVIIYYIDGVERHRVTYTDTRYAPQEVWLSGLANNNWGSGVPDPNASMKVDYFRYYTKRYPGTNLIGNNGFETIGGSYQIVNNWTEVNGIPGQPDTDESKIITATDAYEGSSYLKHENPSNAYNVTTKQRLDYIPNSTYRLTAWVKSSGAKRWRP
ncbi:glycoside hydrolase family 16 protein [Paenibacillus sp. CC-CFT747]|nr:glycoside hydrolase family 16 protein [Paenibacillus sp. CC-CFT747]